jgi:secreted PhoX family phosphatase
MGRFKHEASATDPRTGIVYETEDDGDESGFYRFLPNDPQDLAAGGRLQMLGVAGIDRYDTSTGQVVGRELPVRWVDIPDPDPDLEGGAPKVAVQGLGRGAASFTRLEGIWWEGDHCFFNATSGGEAGHGQVWEHRTGLGNAGRGNSNGRGRGPDPDGPGTLTLVYESPGVVAGTGRSPLDSPDNLTVTPRGGILLCEDDATGADVDTHPLAPGISNVNRLIGLDDDGQPFEFAVNTLNQAEFAGACFAPNAPDVLFVNNFGLFAPGSGMTFAITGPWDDGAL